MERQKTDMIDNELLKKVLEFFEERRLTQANKDVNGKEYQEAVHEYCIIGALYGYDINLEKLILDGNNGNFKLSIINWMMRDLPDLINLTEKFEILRSALRSYLPRLQQFAERDSSLQEVYQSYEQAFGGREK